MSRRRAGVLLLCFFSLVSTARAVAYTVDGHIDDWNVSLSTFNWHYWWSSGTAFVPSSFVPNPLGTIDYAVEDYWPSDSMPAGGEAYDYEALYFDDSPDFFYVGVISSHPWNQNDNTIRVTANGVTVYAADFDEFMWADLGINEVMDGHTYPNYFLEGAIAASKFGNPPIGTAVSVYANCCHWCQIPDSIGLDAESNYMVPEPATLMLVGLGLAALAGRKWRRRRAA